MHWTESISSSGWIRIAKIVSRRYGEDAFGALWVGEVVLGSCVLRFVTSKSEKYRTTTQIEYNLAISTFILGIIYQCIATHLILSLHNPSKPRRMEWCYCLLSLVSTLRCRVVSMYLFCIGVLLSVNKWLCTMKMPWTIKLIIHLNRLCAWRCHIMVNITSM